ncbi:hypothetical protein ACVWY5_000168 [Bradyrhizobium sp. USDA 3256]
MADDLDRIDQSLTATYANRSGKPVEDVKALMKEDRLMSADEAKDFQLMDCARDAGFCAAADNSAMVFWPCINAATAFASAVSPLPLRPPPDGRATFSSAALAAPPWLRSRCSFAIPGMSLRRRKTGPSAISSTSIMMENVFGIATVLLLRLRLNNRSRPTIERRFDLSCRFARWAATLAQTSARLCQPRLKLPPSTMIRPPRRQTHSQSHEARLQPSTKARTFNRPDCAPVRSIRPTVRRFSSAKQLHDRARPCSRNGVDRIESWPQSHLQSQIAFKRPE